MEVPFLKEEEAKTLERKELAKVVREKAATVALGLLMVIITSLFYFYVTLKLKFLTQIIPGTNISIFDLFNIGNLILIFLFAAKIAVDFGILLDKIMVMLVSRLPRQKASSKGTARRIPLDIVYIILLLVIGAIAYPYLVPFEIDAPIIYWIPMGIILTLALVILYDLTKTIYLITEKRIQRIADRFAEKLEKEKVVPVPPEEEEQRISVDDDFGGF